MKLKKFISIFLSATMAVGITAPAIYAANTDVDYTIVNPYESIDWSRDNYYKANLHTHSDVSDGDLSIRDMCQLYYEKGYDILCMTDHGVINNGWTIKPETNGIFNGFRNSQPMSQEEYNRITTGADRDGRGMLDLTGGIEINMAVVTKTHVNGYFTQYGQAVWGNENDYRTAAKKIDELGGYSVLNHVGDWTNSNNFPERSRWNCFISYFAEIFRDYDSCLGMEIINNTDNVTRADRDLWDELLQVVIPTGRNITAFADDDSESVGDVGRSFEYFVLPENTTENVKNAMVNGSFFACSKFQKSLYGDNDFEGNGEVPLVKNIIVDQNADTIELVLDKSRDCSEVKWIADGEVISNSLKLELDDFSDKLGCYVRFELKGAGGVTYSQAFELKYSNRKDAEFPTHSWIFDTSIGKLFLAVYHTLPFGLVQLIVEKVGLKAIELFKK